MRTKILALLATLGAVFAVAIAQPAEAYQYDAGTIVNMRLNTWQPSLHQCYFDGLLSGYPANTHVRIDVRRYNSGDASTYVWTTDLWTSGSGSLSFSGPNDYGTYTGGGWSAIEHARVRVYPYGTTTTIGLDESPQTRIVSRPDTGCFDGGTGDF